MWVLVALPMVVRVCDGSLIVMFFANFQLLTASSPLRLAARPSLTCTGVLGLLFLGCSGSLLFLGGMLCCSGNVREVSCQKNDFRYNSANKGESDSPFEFAQFRPIELGSRDEVNEILSSAREAASNLHV
jgi:hypothetical protein